MYPIVDICVCKDFYLADRLMHDTVQEAEQILAEAENPEVTIPQEA